MSATSPVPITYSVRDACSVSSLGRTRLYELIKSGKVATIKVGRRTLIDAVSLRRLLQPPGS